MPGVPPVASQGANDGLTRRLAQRLVELHAGELPAALAPHARRTLFNALAVAVGAARHPAVRIVVGLAHEHGGRPTVTLPGRRTRLDAHHAALAIGLATHVEDYDDTHLGTVVHPGAAALGATFAIGQWRGSAGVRMLGAFALACETQIRLAEALGEEHFRRGWHVTGTCGAIGAAAGAGLLCGLDVERLAHAIGIAGSQTLGLREAHGTMVKSAHPGKAAANGLLATLLAERGFSGPLHGLEAPRGYFRALAEHADPDRLLDGLGERWELLQNTFKPYPSGVVTHPAIDAARELAPRLRAAGVSLTGDRTTPASDGAHDVWLEEIEVVCNPLVLELTAQRHPPDGLHARFSTPHTVAAALVEGDLGVGQLSDAYVALEPVARVRELVRLSVDSRIAPDEAIVRLRLSDGQLLEHHVEHARGSRARPLGDLELHAKAQALIDPVLPQGADAVAAAVQGLAQAPDLRELVAALTPTGDLEPEEEEAAGR